MVGYVYLRDERNRFYFAILRYTEVSKRNDDR